MEFQKRQHKQRIPPKTNMDYKTDWFLADLRDIDKQIYEMIQNFMLRTRAFRNKQLWAKYAIFLYLFAPRRTEPFLYNSTIQKYSNENGKFYRLSRKNEKHFEGKKLNRQLLKQLFIAWNKYDLALFNYLLDNKETITLDFSPLLPPRSKKVMQSEDSEKYKDVKVLRSIMNDVSARFSGMFKADITNGEKPIKDGGLVPHMLRHLRAYDLLINKNMRDTSVARLVGWKTVSMVYHYSYLSRAMQEKEMEQIYKNMRQNP